MRISSIGTLTLVMITVAVVNDSADVRARGQTPAPAQPQTPTAASTPARDSPGGAARVPSARIRGRVVNTDGVPLRRAEVRLTGLAAANSRDVSLLATDEQGSYEFRNLPAGRYTLEASKSGFMTVAHGQRRPFESARPVEVADGQVLEGIDIGLIPGGTIVARVTDRFGEPMSGVNVQVLHYRVPTPDLQSIFSGNARRLISITGVVTAGIATNDLGVQRIYGLPPGEYYVGVRVPWGPADTQRSYAPTFYPGTTSFAEAQKVRVGLGQEIDVSFPLVAQQSFTISGSVRNASGGMFSSPFVQLFDESAASRGSAPYATLQNDGSFTFQRVFPGEYAITVVGGMTGTNPMPEFVKVPVTVVNRDITNLALVTNTGAMIHGRILFDTGDPPASLRPGSVQFTYASPQNTCNGGRTTWNQDWTFDSRGVNCDAARLSLTAATAPGWYLKGFMLDGKDVSDIPFSASGGMEIKDLQVVLTRTRTEVSGAAIDAQGAALSDYVALFFPQDRVLWNAVSRQIAATRADQKGQFKVAGLPPGRYLAVAIDYLPAGEERDVELLDRVRGRAIEMTLGEGEAQSVRLPLATY